MFVMWLTKRSKKRVEPIVWALSSLLRCDTVSSFQMQTQHSELLLLCKLNDLGTNTNLEEWGDIVWCTEASNLDRA